MNNRLSWALQDISGSFEVNLTRQQAEHFLRIWESLNQARRLQPLEVVARDE